MINSRLLTDLRPVVEAKARAHIAACAAEGIDLLVTSTFRDFESQGALYAQGRTKPGTVVTNAKPGDSFHQWRVAYDVVPLVGGKPIWGRHGDDLARWHRVGELGLAEGLEWGGKWITFPEFPHFQFTGGLTIRDLAKGSIPQERRA